MPDTVSKTDNFLKAIEKYAQEQRSKIESEAEDFKKHELNKAEEEGLREAYVLIQKKMTDIRTKIAADLSRAETASRKKIFIRRKEIEDAVFEKAAKKLAEYTETDDYEKAMEKSAKRAGDLLDADDAVIYVRKSDLHMAEKLKKAFGHSVSVEAGSEIRLGGLTAQSRSRGLLVDETLDSRLEQQHEWFCENSGLKVTE